MGRLVRVLIYALVIFILYFWVTALIKSYQKTHNTAENESNLPDSTLTDSLDKMAQIQDSLLNADTLNNQMISNEDIVDGGINYNDVDAKLKEIEEKKLKTSVPQKKEKTEGSVDKAAPSEQQPASKPALKPKENTPEPVKDIKTRNVSELSGDGGVYMVMAGSYLLKENAQKMVNRLKKAGYVKAEIIVFPASEFHSVIAVRYSSENQAQAASEELKRKGIDSFVKKK